jgi:formiminotetrahydrofolate cyclodeaminase
LPLSAPPIPLQGEVLRRRSGIAATLETLVDADTDAYDRVVDAYRLPKVTDEEKTARTERIQAALKSATDVPLEVMRQCAAALAESAGIARLGNQNAVSDVNVGIAMLRAGLSGARENVETNVGSIKDADYIARVRAESSRLAT